MKSISGLKSVFDIVMAFQEWIVKSEYPLKLEWYSYHRERLATMQVLGALLTHYFPGLKSKNIVYTIIEKLEQGCVDATIQHDSITNNNWRNDRFITVYQVKATTLIRNMDPESTVGQSRVIAGLLATPGYAYEKIPLMKPEQYQPELNELYTKQIKESDQLKNNIKGGWSKTRQHECTKCGKTDCEYRAVQIRSGDEDASIFYRCISCNHVDFDF